MAERLADLFLALATAAETEAGGIIDADSVFVVYRGKGETNALVWAGGELHDLLHDAITVAVDMKHEGVMPAARGLH